MINENIVRGSENITSLRHTKQVLGSTGKGSTRPKGNALGDVRNTLHSRPNANYSSGKPPPQKGKIQKVIKDENIFSVRKALPEKSIPKPESKIATSNLFSPKFEENDFHDHSLCEHAEELSFNNFYNDYKLKSRDINNLVKRIRPFKIMTPLKRNMPDLPCEDVVMVENRIWEDEEAVDSFDHIEIPDVCPP